MGYKGVDISTNLGVSDEENDEDEFIEHLDNHTEVSGKPTMEIPEKRRMHEPASEMFTEIDLAKDTSGNSLGPALHGRLWDPEIDEPIVVRCKMQEQCQCKWRLGACKEKSHVFFEITKYVGLHTCLYMRLNQDHDRLDAKFIAEMIQPLVKKDPSVHVEVFIASVTSAFHYNISYKRCWNAKQKAIAMIFGDWKETYKALPKFKKAI
ncbi:hypothetical protein Acr_00g0034920 [Actinidia rufa]|uniref:Uncharacterized protein n=1 Tax=Actinidia rufa TaxID=165716 RepID=A0A7J0DH75_9ERIC|nr:hypothetical protein Acr_00g0034920 [Actinidia rufa]